MARRLLFLGGNGHCAARLDGARQAIARLTVTGAIAPFDLVEVAYPGFEHRPRARDFESFLKAISQNIEANADGATRLLLYGTGIGGLLALCLRARGECMEVPLLLQAPVLWGLERRLMPRLMRSGLARVLIGRLFAWGWFQRRFVRKQFERPLSREMQAAFFAGYASCAALADFFDWLTPQLLCQLQQQFTARPEALHRIAFWWGGRDRVVSLQELAWTEQALGTRFDVRHFPAWGHYPMIDEPEDWVRNLDHALASAEAISRSVGPEAQ